MTENWFHAAQGAARGPFGRAHILELIASGEIGPQTLVWRKELPDWQAANAHFDFAPSTAAPQGGTTRTEADEAAPIVTPEPVQPAAHPAQRDWIAHAREAAPAPQVQAPWSAVAASAAPHHYDRVPMDPLTAIRRVYARYFTFSGRAGRGEFWWFTLFYMLALIALTTVDLGILQSPFAPLSSVFMLLNLFPVYTVSTRRLHDSGASGWWMVAQFVVPLGMMALAAVFFIGQLQALDVPGGMNIRHDDVLQGLFGALLAYVLAGLVSLVLSIMVIVLLARRGDLGTNKYGPPPP